MHGGDLRPGSALLGNHVITTLVTIVEPPIVAFGDLATLVKLAGENFESVKALVTQPCGKYGGFCPRGIVAGSSGLMCQHCG